MKKIFIMAAAALAVLAGCNKIESAPETPNISVTPEKYVFGPEGGSASVIVTATSEWNLEAVQACDWLTVDKKSGRDGDIVTFTATPNAGTQDLSAEYTFKMGGLTSKFVAISRCEAPKTLELTSAQAYDLPFTAERLDLEFSTNLNYRDLEYSLSEGAESWISFRVAASPQKDAAALGFILSRNEGRENRSAEITVSAEGVEPVTVTLTQRAEPFIRPSSNLYVVSMTDFETLVVPVDANVEYEATYPGAEDWLICAVNEGEITVVAYPENKKRTATVTLTEKNPLAGYEPVVASFDVCQGPAALITRAANMTGKRAKPTWSYDGTYDKFSRISQFTYEALVLGKSFNTTLSTIMGIEGETLLRLGDNSSRKSQIQAAGTAATITAPSQYDLKPNTWYHLALVYDTGVATVYCNGQQVVTGQICNTYWAAKDLTWNFYVGYSYENGRELDGYLSELRIWTRCLTAAEINAENHFYQVDPQSEGLEVYWKMDDADGTTTFHDYTGHGNVLTCQAAYGWNECEAAFAAVALPE